jgi:hypothetical protein
MSIKINEDRQPYKDTKKPLQPSLKKWFLVLMIVSIVHLIGFYFIDSRHWLTYLPQITEKNFQKSISMQLNYTQEVAPEIPTISNTELESSDTRETNSIQEQAKPVNNNSLPSEENTPKPLSQNTQVSSTTQHPIKEKNTITKVKENQEDINIKATKAAQTPQQPFITTPKNTNDVTAEFKDYVEAKKTASLSDSFEIIQETFTTTPPKKEDSFNNVFSKEYKIALQDAIQEQKQYLKGFIKSKGYQITKDADGTRYVNIKGICWKMPPEGESGEWFIVPAGCNNQKESFHFEFGITPEMLSPNSPFSRLLGLEFDPNQ